jgi:hypothetical protein
MSRASTTLRRSGEWVIRRRQRPVVPPDVAGRGGRVERLVSRRGLPGLFAGRGHGGQPRVARAVAAEDRARHDEHRAVGRVVEGEGAERDKTRATAADSVLDARTVGDLTQPLLRGDEPVGAGGQRHPGRLTPAGQARGLPDPGECRGYRDLAEEFRAGVGDRHAAHHQAPAAIVADARCTAPVLARPTVLLDIAVSSEGLRHDTEV